MSFVWFLPFRLSDWDFVCISHLTHACYMPRLSRPLCIVCWLTTTLISSHLTSCTVTKSNLQFASSMSTLFGQPAPTFRVPNHISIFRSCIHNCEETTLKTLECVVGWCDGSWKDVVWGVDWIHLAQDRTIWRDLVNTIMKLRVP
jgi:hypothetical protein